MLIFSHRGYHAQCPENTLEAFKCAASMGAHGIETDVRLDVQGTPILYHDRLTPDGEPVSSLTRSQLSSAVGFDVPTLADALREGPDDVLWNLEIKTPLAVEQTISTLHSFLVPVHGVI